MSENEFNYFKDNRKYIRIKVTKKCNSVKNNLNEFSAEDRKGEIDELKVIQESLYSCNKIIGKNIWQHESDRTVLNAELDSIEKYTNEINKTFKLLETVNTVPGPSADPAIQLLPVTNKIKLPQMQLPVYGHTKGESLHLFLLNFDTIIDKYNLTDYEKFMYLKQQLKNEAHTLVSSLQGTHQSYTDARALLERAFASPLVQKLNTIEQLTKLKLNRNGDPYTFVSEMRNLIHSFDSLQINTDVVLQYFLWQAMPEDLRTQLVLLTNSSKPNVVEIETNIFEAIDRFKTNNKVSGHRSEDPVAGFAANVNVGDYKYSSGPNKNKNYRNCILCQGNNDEHTISKCTQFLTPQAKRERLKVLKLCLKCLRSGHFAADCAFKFNKNCYNCNNNSHFSFLCNKLNQGASAGYGKYGGRSIPEGPQIVVQGSTAMVGSSTFSSNCGGNVVLPTFTGKLPDGKLIRGLKDTGSQSSFISKKVVEEGKFRIIKDNIVLLVNGINTTIEYKTKIVELNVKLGSRQCKIPAVVVPNINIQLELPGLSSIVAKFILMGYSLADKELSEIDDNICNLNFILGAGALYCIPDKTVVFGNSSIYYDSSCGIMLSGMLSTMAADLHNLPRQTNHEGGVVSEECRVAQTTVLQTTKTPESQIVQRTTQPGFLGSQICDVEGKQLNAGRAMQFGDEACSLQVSCFHSTFAMVDHMGELSSKILTKATEAIINESSTDILNETCTNFLRIEDRQGEEDDVINEELVNYTLSRCSRDGSGHLMVPILWNPRNVHLLGNNFELSRQILASNLKKLLKNQSHLDMVDQVFQDQLGMDIISPIKDLDGFRLEHKDCSFLPHMPVFKLNKLTTKCRVVLLANLVQKNIDKSAVSHNQAILPGPSLNKKIGTSLINLRFDKKLLVFDISKAFLRLKLFPQDQVKLCLLWFRNVAERDFKIIAYKMNRLPFGLPCSPALLMLSLYKLLVLDNIDTENSEISELKKDIYDRMFMDNAAVGSNSTEHLLWAFNQVERIFEEFKFPLQQFVTNDPQVRDAIMNKYGETAQTTPKLLGLNWNVECDTLATDKLVLDAVSDTKRRILSTIAQNYDLFNFNGPILNRARLFLQGLQVQPELGWDDTLSEVQLKEWQNISHQVNKAEVREIPRYMGKKTDTYQLVVCTDSSKSICGAVLYVFNNNTKTVNFVLAKNRLVGKSLEQKSIPCLELEALTLGTEVLLDTYRELAGESTISPVIITELKVFTDSCVCLSWLQSYNYKFSKPNKLSVFVRNRLTKINKLCETHHITYRFCEGKLNPADYISRPVSYDQLIKSNYFTGLPPEMIDAAEGDIPHVVVPNPLTGANEFCMVAGVASSQAVSHHHPLLDFSRCSSYSKVVRIYKNIFKFINNIKLDMLKKAPERYQHFAIINEAEISVAAHRVIMVEDQCIHFLNVHSYMDRKVKLLKDLPPIVAQLNIFRDSLNILRVKAKFKKWRDQSGDFPILLSKNSRLSELIIRDLHQKLLHAGKYAVLSEIRKHFWIPNVFSVVKRVLGDCLHCRRFNAKAIKLPQGYYRQFRLEPSNIPYRSLFLDYCGPFYVRFHGQKTKIYLLIITCLWSRAVNIQICLDLTVSSFLRAFQLHIYEFGLPELVLSDMGSQIVSGAKIITNFLKEPTARSYLTERDIKTISFEQYAKGHSELGSLVETMVKLVKRLLFGSIRNLILDYFQYEFIVKQTIHMINRRPIAFKSGLRDGSVQECVPQAITPEILIRGHELVSLNTIPSLEDKDTNDPQWLPPGENIPHIRDSCDKLLKARKYLTELYNEEFLAELSSQATSVKGRYKPMKLHSLAIGDLVLLKESLTKINYFPKAIVVEVFTNDFREVTSAVVRKPVTRELVRRHVTTLIPLLRRSEYCEVASDEADKQPTAGSLAEEVPPTGEVALRPIRHASEKCKKRLQQHYEENAE